MTEAQSWFGYQLLESSSTQQYPSSRIPVVMCFCALWEYEVTSLSEATKWDGNVHFFEAWAPSIAAHSKNISAVDRDNHNITVLCLSAVPQSTEQEDRGSFKPWSKSVFFFGSNRLQIKQFFSLKSSLPKCLPFSVLSSNLFWRPYCTSSSSTAAPRLVCMVIFLSLTWNGSQSFLLAQ